MPKSKKESQLDVIARHVAEMHQNMATKDDLKAFATKDDIRQLEKNIRQDMATKDHIKDLEKKLIEDTDAVTGVEQKHYRSHAQRIARLEKEVFPKAF